MFENIEDPRKPPEDFLPDNYNLCPMCGESAEDFYLDAWNNLIGCSECLKRISAEDHYNNTHCA